MRKALVIAVAVAAVSFNSLPASSGQAAQGSRPVTEGVGDTPDNPPALADLSGAFKRKPIDLAMRKVGDWELKRAGPYFCQDLDVRCALCGLHGRGRRTFRSRATKKR